jgi:hypothetical protein
VQNPPWGNHRAQGHRSIGHKGTKSNRNSELNLHLLQRPGQSPGLCTTSVFILESNAFGQYAWNSIRRAANAFAALVLIDRIVLRANGYRPLRYNPYCPWSALGPQRPWTSQKQLKILTDAHGIIVEVPTCCCCCYCWPPLGLPGSSLGLSVTIGHKGTEASGTRAPTVTTTRESL